MRNINIQWYNIIHFKNYELLQHITTYAIHYGRRTVSTSTQCILVHSNDYGDADDDDDDDDDEMMMMMTMMIN